MNIKLLFIASLSLLSVSLSINIVFGKPIIFNNTIYHEKFIDSTPIAMTNQFIHWYKQNKKRINVKIVKGGGKDSNSFYSIDYKEVDKYINKLKNSSYFSTKFCKDLFAYIDLCAAHLKKNPQNDFIPFGFEIDLVTKLMDDLDFMDYVESLTYSYIQISDKQATVSVKSLYSTEMLFILTKYSGKWKIDSINGDFVLNKSIPSTNPILMLNF